MMILTGKTITSALSPPFPYGIEFVQQFMFLLRLCWLPLTITTIAFGYGAPGLQAGNFLVIFGAIDRLGGFFVLSSVREFAPIASAVILAGGGGAGVTAGFGGGQNPGGVGAFEGVGVGSVKNLGGP